MIKICKKHYKEVEREKEEQIWFIVVDFFMDLLNNDIIKNKFYVKAYIRDRLNIFADSLVRAIPFKSFLDHQLNHNKKLKFKNLSCIITKHLGGLRSEKQVLANSNNAIYKVNSELFQIF